MITFDLSSAYITPNKAHYVEVRMVFHAVIPARFLTLMAHLVLNAMLFWSRVSLKSS